jgi:glycosyltransferase involved in cell wall biosynthesis
MEKIKLVQVIGDSEMGGGPTHILGILKNIDKEIFDCYLICPNGFLSREAEKVPSVTVVKLPFASKFDIKTIMGLKKELSRIQALDNPFAEMIVHSHGPRAGFFAALETPASVTKFYTEHRWDGDYHLTNFINEFVQKQMLKFVCDKADQILAVSSSVKDFLIKKLSVTENKIIILSNGIEIEKNTGTKRKRPVDGTFVIGTIGTLNIQKGQKYLLEAMPSVLKKYPLLQLEIIGAGEEEKNLKLKAKNLNIEKNVLFLGKQKDVYKYLNNWDLFVLPSVAETFGIVLLEAMQAGVPVVASNVGGVVDIIKNKENGILVKSKNSKLLAKAIIDLLDEPNLADKLRGNAFLTLKKLEWSSVIKELENIYKNT